MSSHQTELFAAQIILIHICSRYHLGMNLFVITAARVYLMSACNGGGNWISQISKSTCVPPSDCEGAFSETLTLKYAESMLMRLKFRTTTSSASALFIEGVSERARARSGSLGHSSHICRPAPAACRRPL